MNKKQVVAEWNLPKLGHVKFTMEEYCQTVVEYSPKYEAEFKNNEKFLTELKKHKEVCKKILDS